MRTTNRIDLKAYRTADMMRWAIYKWKLESDKGGTLRRRGPCPICSAGIRGRRDFAVEPHRGVWYCHKCKRSGDSLTLWAELAKCSVWQAAKELSAISGTPVPWLDDLSRGVCMSENENLTTTPGLADWKNNLSDVPPVCKPDEESAFLRVLESAGGLN